MFERVYLGPAVRAEHRRIAGVVRCLFEHYVECPQELPGGADEPIADEPIAGERELAQRVTDYLAGMTDRYCIARFSELEVPQAFAR